MGKFWGKLEVKSVTLPDHEIIAIEVWSGGELQFLEKWRP